MSPPLFSFPHIDALQQGAAQFEQQAGALKNKMWWKNMKVRPRWYSVGQHRQPPHKKSAFVFIWQDCVLVCVRGMSLGLWYGRRFTTTNIYILIMTGSVFRGSASGP